MEERLPRKLAAILYADIVGYSRLTGDDEDATHRRLSEYLDLVSETIEQHRGRVMHYAGDAVLAQFGAVLDAMSTAVAIQKELRIRNDPLSGDRKVQFRIGINSGDVIEDRGDIYGDGVNVAARLESLANPGGICISDAVRTAVGKKLDIDYEDMGEQEVKNISQPVRAYRVDLVNSQLQTDGSGKVTPGELPAVAVLPFTNLSGDPEQEYFSDGLTEDIITGLSYWRAFPIIARNSTFTYKGVSVRVQEIAQELGARYVLEGSVRTAGKRIRVTAQLIDGETGHHVWAEKYDRALEDIFEVQDEITLSIVATVQPELVKAEIERSAASRPGSLRAWDFFLRGMAHIHRFTIKDNAAARDMFQKAIDLENNYGEAWAGLGWGYVRDIDFRSRESRQSLIDKGFNAARKAVELDDSSALAHLVLGTAYVWAENLKLGIAQVEKCIELNPYSAHAHMALGNRLDLVGRTDEGIDKMERSLELNPRDPWRPNYMAYLARAYASKGDYETALVWIERAVNLRLDDADLQYRLAICLANLGKVDDARDALGECERLHPGQVSERSSWRPYSDDERNKRFFAGLKKHGLAV
ncbi:MAG: tetratricopeptide repeat protein [Gammaproteobacteria bacterium]|jgi:adenylate cyclase|nr:tetratricopeptide repeat protein [Gammaproteobacteria bacterium]